MEDVQNKMSANNTVIHNEYDSFHVKHTHHDYHTWEITIPQEKRAGLMLWANSAQQYVCIRNGTQEIAFPKELIGEMIDALCKLESALIKDGGLYEGV